MKTRQPTKDAAKGDSRPLVAAEPIAAQPAPAKTRGKRRKKSKPRLLFIDTNILLDFYRARNDAGISLLSKIDALHGQTITTCQLAMEFKKNRQKVITESFSLLKPPDFSLSTPAFLSDAATVKVIRDRIHDVKKRVEKLKGRILSTMENPKTHDRIYQTIQRLLNNTGPLNLRHDTPEYKAVWRKALRRFLEGRPPRKKDDTSAGDAINWEWIIYCIRRTNRDVIVVSRDADYGLTLDGKSYANNWLTDEVKERVNQQRKLILVDRLSAALKLLDVKVTAEEITSERAIITSAVPPLEGSFETAVVGALDTLLDAEDISSLIARTNASNWTCDAYKILNGRINDGIWKGLLAFSFSGEQDTDKPWRGTDIIGTCHVEIDQSKNVRFNGISASLSEEDEPDQDEPDQDEPDQDEPDQDEPDQDEPDQDEPKGS